MGIITGIVGDIFGNLFFSTAQVNVLAPVIFNSIFLLNHQFCLQNPGLADSMNVELDKEMSQLFITSNRGIKNLAILNQ